MNTSFSLFPMSVESTLSHCVLDAVFAQLRTLYDAFLFYTMQCSLAFRKQLRRLLQDDRGIGTIELVLILVVLIALVLIFKDRIRTLLNSIFDQIESSATSVY